MAKLKKTCTNREKQAGKKKQSQHRRSPQKVTKHGVLPLYPFNHVTTPFVVLYCIKSKKEVKAIVWMLSA